MANKDDYIKEYLGSYAWESFVVYRAAGLSDNDIADILYDQCLISYIERDNIKSFKGE